MLNSLYCTLDQLIIARSTMPQNDEAFIDGFTWQRVLNFKTNLPNSQKRKKRKRFVYENLHFGLEKSPDKAVGLKKRINVVVLIQLEAFINGFTWSKVVNFKTNFHYSQKKKKRKSFVYESSCSLTALFACKYFIPVYILICFLLIQPIERKEVLVDR